MTAAGSPVGRHAESGPRPRVSVACITFQQAPYIARAIEGVAAQRTDFPVELVIGEDQSSDGTRAIVEDLARRHPGLIRLLDTPGHLGMIRNFVRTLRACQGHHIALLEGDDYWTAPDKLRRQVEFLDAHPECSGCFHDAVVHHEDGAREDHAYCPGDLPESLTLEDLLVVNVIPTCSAMFRFSCLPVFAAPYETFGFGDWPLHVLVARNGPFGYLRERMAVYRVHASGVWATMTEVRRRLETIRIYGYLDQWLEGAHHDLIQSRVGEEHYRLAVLHEKARDRRRAVSHALLGLRASPVRSRVPVRQWIGLWARFALPPEPDWALHARLRLQAALHLRAAH